MELAPPILVDSFFFFFFFVCLFFFLISDYSHHGGLESEDSAFNVGDGGSLLGKTLLEKGMATHCVILAWRIPWTEEPGGLQSMGSQIVWQACALRALCFIWHYSEPSSCRMQRSCISFLNRQQKPLFERNQTQSVEEKTWSQGPWNNGLEASFEGAGPGKGRILGAGTQHLFA